MMAEKMSMDELNEVAAEFLAAGRKYWEAAHKAGIGGAVIWVSDTADGLVLFTRGEYRETLMRNIDYLSDNVRYFGAGKIDPS
jgi:hypothetical protein